MKKRGILNADLARAIAALGHTDVLVVADAGLPIPAGVPVVDLAVVAGLPRFAHVLEAILDEMEIDRCVMAQEAAPAVQSLAPSLPDLIPHDEFKVLTHTARVIVRTGEVTPFANIALISGVTF